MATVRPFQAITYDPTRVSEASDVTCPPYDVISPVERTQLYDRHPYNIVRIVSGREEPQDHEGDNKYTRACAFFRSWLWEGVLREDTEPALYVYRQAFTDPQGQMRRVWGLLGTVCLDDEILAHERTMPGPKEDRLALMNAVPANLSPIYALYREEGGGVSASLPEHTNEQPVADVVDDDGTRHTAWPVHDHAFHERVASGLASSPLFIADGHHRFETAKLYRDGRRAADGEGAWDHVLTLLVDAGTQAVCILPYHRIVRRLGPADVVGMLGQHFDVAELGPLREIDATTLEQQLWGSDAGTFFCFLPGGAYRLSATDVAADVPAGVLKRSALDVLDIGPAEEALSFSPKGAEVLEEVASGRAPAGFLIPPVTVDRVWDVAATGGKMPEKSTYFYPKPRDGIVIRALEPCS
jgi:uncharacterized protein (DUF1015 family)